MQSWLLDRACSFFVTTIMDRLFVAPTIIRGKKIKVIIDIWDIF
jgi:hypothetical protein